MRVLVAIVGSLGDVNPRLAIGRELQRRGHDVVIATHACHRQRVEAAGLAFRTLRPESISLEDPIGLARQGIVDSALASSVLSQSSAIFEDLLAACADADLVVSSDAVIPVGLVAFAQRIPWVHTLITPAALAPDAPSPEARRRLAQSVKTRTRALAALCNAHGIAAAAVYERPGATIALFSPALVQDQAPEMSGVPAVGFCFYESEDALDASITDFLKAGDPPVVFTFGSASPIAVEALFDVSLAAVAALGVRAIFLTWGKRADLPCESSFGQKVLLTGNPPYSQLFPCSRAIVHHGGIGSVSWALRAGKPMVISPLLLDQPANAERVRRLGVARVIMPENYRADTLIDELGRVLDDASYAQNAQHFSKLLASENGPSEACRIIERMAAA